MKKTFTIIPMVILLVLFGAHSVMSLDTKTAELESLYENYIDGHISRCESKAARINSKSEHIRNEAAVHTLMGAFFRDHRDELVKEMIAKDIGTKKHQVDYYLNSKFFGLLRKAEKASDL
jgi:hypothetical protein